MAKKKDFKKTTGFVTGMYSGSKRLESDLEAKRTGKQKVSEKGFIRRTLMIRPEHIEELRDVAKLAKADIQDVLAAALDKYFLENWPDEKREELRALREKEAQAIKNNLL